MVQSISRILSKINVAFSLFEFGFYPADHLYYITFCTLYFESIFSERSLFGVNVYQNIFELNVFWCRFIFNFKGV